MTAIPIDKNNSDSLHLSVLQFLDILSPERPAFNSVSYLIDKNSVDEVSFNSTVLRKLEEELYQILLLKRQKGSKKSLNMNEEKGKEEEGRLVVFDIGAGLLPQFDQIISLIEGLNLRYQNEYPAENTSLITNLTYFAIEKELGSLYSNINSKLTSTYCLKESNRCDLSAKELMYTGFKGVTLNKRDNKEESFGVECCLSSLDFTSLEGALSMSTFLKERNLTVDLIVGQ